MSGPIGDSYTRLKELQCVPCERCGGSYMLPDHIEHRSVLDPLVFEKKKTPDVPPDATPTAEGTPESVGAADVEDTPRLVLREEDREAVADTLAELLVADNRTDGAS
jgi:hypothetical protein